MNQTQRKNPPSLTVIRADESIRNGMKLREQFHCLRGVGFCSETELMRFMREYALDHGDCRELVILQSPAKNSRLTEWENALLQSLRRKLLSAGWTLRIQSPADAFPSTPFCGILLLPSACNFCKTAGYTIQQKGRPVIRCSGRKTDEPDTVYLDMQAAWLGYLLELIRQDCDALLVLGSAETGEELCSIWEQNFADRNRALAIACVPERPDMVADPVFAAEILSRFSPKAKRIAIFCETGEYRDAWLRALEFDSVPESRVKTLVPPVCPASVFDMAEEQTADRLLALLLMRMEAPEGPAPCEPVYAAMKRKKREKKDINRH